jgi:hypothetical protein
LAVNNTFGSAKVSCVTLPFSRRNAIFAVGTPVNAEPILLQVDGEEIALPRSVNVLPNQRITIGGRKRLRWCRCVRVAEGGEVLHDGCGIRSTSLGVRHQRDPVGAERLLNAGTSGDHRLHRVDLPHHRSRKQCRAGAVREQEVRDGFVADVRGRIDARLPVTEAPINRRARHGGLLLHQFADAGEVAVRGAYRILDERWLQLWEGVSAGDGVRKRRRRLSPRPGGECGDTERGQT